MTYIEQYINDISVGCNVSKELIQEFAGKVILPREDIHQYLRFNLPFPGHYIDKDRMHESLWNTEYQPMILLTQDHFRSLYQILVLTVDINVFRAFLKEHNYL